MSAQDILNDILSALKTEVGAGFSTIKDYATTQGNLLAKQAEHIAESRIGGSLKNDDDLYHWMLDGLQRDTVNMTRAIAALTVLTIEEAWNAVAGALWKGISGLLTAAGLPAAILPDAPPHV